MSRREEERHDEARPTRGNTVTAQGDTQSPKARQPNEHDESADSQAADSASARRVGAIAHDDVKDGLQDTTKGQELDATYHRVRQENAPPEEKPPGRRER